MYDARSKGETGGTPVTDDVGECGLLPEWLLQFDAGFPIALLPSPKPSSHLSIDRRRAFIKKLETVASSRPKLADIAICCSFVGRRFSLEKNNEIFQDSLFG